jgi:FkbM family methyltransferase
MGLLLGVLDWMPAGWIRTAGALRGRSRWLKASTDWLPALLRNREGRIQKGLGRGLRFNGANSAVGFVLGTHDYEVQCALQYLLQPGMLTFDIGANVGFTALLAARQVGPTGRVVCFEPLPANAEQIRHNARLNGFDQIDVHCTALGRDDGEAEFQLSESPTWGRLTQSGTAPRPNGIIRVPVRRLDSLVAADALPPPALVKMDVEGAEADVIAGSRALLGKARPLLIIELHHTFHAVQESLAGLDYEVRPLTPDHGGESQILAYPRERQDIAVARAELVAAMAVGP